MSVKQVQVQIMPSTSWIDMPAANYRAESGVLDDGATYTVRVRWRGRGGWVLAGVMTTIANPSIPAAPIQVRWMMGLSEWAMGQPLTPALIVMTGALRRGAVRPEPARAAGPRR